MSLIGNFFGSIGYFKHVRGDLEGAAPYYAKAYKHGLSNPSLKMAYGVLLLRTAEYQKAKDIFEELLKCKLKDNMVLAAKTNLAMSLWKLGHIIQAIEILKEINKSYKNSRLYGNLGYLLIEAGNYDDAEKYNLEALDYDDEDPVILDNLGQLYFRKKEYEKSEEYLKKAESIKPNQLDTHYYLACIGLINKKYDEALDEINKASECRIEGLSTLSREMVNDKLKEIEDAKKDQGDEEGK